MEETMPAIGQDGSAAEINALKNLLEQSDYKALKYADGALSEEEYAETRAQRAAWRAKINELQQAGE